MSQRASTTRHGQLAIVFAVTIAVVLPHVALVDAFTVAPLVRTAPTTSTVSTTLSASLDEWSDMERDRPTRRDVFSYDLWVDHRSTDRFIGNLREIFSSQIFKALLPACFFTSIFATLVCLYNALLVTGYDDFTGLHHAALIDTKVPVLKMPADFFSLCTPSLALLLIFRTNTSYRRWDEGRKNWGAMVNSSRTILREAAAWIQEAAIPNDDKQRLMERMEQAVWCFNRSVTRHLLSAREDAADYAADCRGKLRPDLAEDLIAARHKPTRALYELSAAINELPVDELRIIAMDRSASILCDSMGSSERIFTSPIPRFYTRHTARFLEMWVLLLPLALYEPFARSWNHWAMIPATFIATGFLIGIDELALQLEEPFSILPQHGITNNSIGKVLTESVGWRKTDYERSVEAATQRKGPLP